MLQLRFFEGWTDGSRMELTHFRTVGAPKKHAFLKTWFLRLLLSWKNDFFDCFPVFPPFPGGGGWRKYHQTQNNSQLCKKWKLKHGESDFFLKLVLFLSWIELNWIEWKQVSIKRQSSLPLLGSLKKLWNWWQKKLPEGSNESLSDTRCVCESGNLLGGGH